jgi:hypothetical protein
MRKIGAILGIAALAAVVLSPLPDTAFGFHLGRFYFHLPLVRHHYRQEAALDNLSAASSQAFAPPTRRMSLGQYQDIPELIPRDGSALGFDIV